MTTKTRSKRRQSHKNGWEQSEAGQQLQERLTNEQTLLALTRLLDRIDGLEQTVQTLVTTIEQGPGFVSMVADTVDEGYRQATLSGIDLEGRLKAGLTMADKLTAPETVAVLDKLLSRIGQVGELVEMADQAPGMISMVADTADEAYRQAAEAGIDLEGRLKAGLTMADKLTAPETVAVLDKLLSRIGQVGELVEMADQAPGMISMVADTADEAYRQAAEAGIDLEGRLKAGLTMADKLTAPETVAVLDKLLSRIGQVGELVEMADQAPGMISMVADTADEAYRQAAEAGIDLEGRLKAGLTMADKLTAPETVAVLDKLLSRIGQVGELVEMADQAPGMISMVADTADEAYRQAAEAGIDLEGRLKAGLTMADKLTAPETVAVLSALLDRTDKLGQAIDLIDQGPGLAAMAMDTLDEAYRQALSAGVDIDALVQQGGSITSALANFISSEAFQSLQKSGVLEPKVLKVVGSAGEALVTTQQQPIKPLGPFDLFKAIRDPDTRRALGFLLTFGQNFGKTL